MVNFGVYVGVRIGLLFSCCDAVCDEYLVYLTLNSKMYRLMFYRIMLKKVLLLIVAVAVTIFAYANPKTDGGAPNRIRYATPKTDGEGPNYIQYVNPMVGTDFHGHTFPGATYPFGMMQLSPDTRTDNWDGCSGYHYSDSTIWGFSHTHLSGTGCADYCDILMMPVTDFEGTVKQENAVGRFPNDYIFTEYYASKFSHDREEASPGYYKVYLDKWRVEAELTVGRRAGMHKYRYPGREAPEVIIDLEHRDQVIDSQINMDENNRSAIYGFRRSKSWASDQIIYFYIEFSSKIDKSYILNSESEYGSKALLRFKPRQTNELFARIGISTVSVENAKLNLQSEIVNWDFRKLRKSTEQAWNSYLSKIEVSGYEEDKQIFYTAMYHTAISPNLYSDVNGEYRGMDRKVHTAIGYEHYTVFSLWDTFRSLHPLLNIIERNRTVDFIKSFLSIYSQAGKLPVWELSGNETNCMIGYNAVPVIADAITKGITDFDVEKALEAMVVSSNKAEFGIDINAANGLVLAEKEHESVSKTMEYAFDDWCIAQTAKYLRNYGKGMYRDSYDSLYVVYINRAQHYKNLFDPSTKFMRPRVNGIWLSPFNPSEVNVHYTEANAWQYTMHVQQDVSGLIDLFGGEEQFGVRMDELFSTSSTLAGWNSADMTGMIGQYVQGNEPSHHIAYLYSYVGQPWKSQKIVRQIMRELFTSDPDGLCGNEDCGQMSAWYVLSSLGFYPVTPGSDLYVFGSPVFTQAVINLESGRQFKIEAPVNNKKNIYVVGVSRDGEPYTKSYMHQADIDSGSTFTFSMAATPNRDFGAAPEDRPVSAINGNLVANPWVNVPNRMFKKSVEVSLGALREDYRIWYRIETADKPSAKYVLYSDPFTVTESCTISAYCQDAAGVRSYVTRTPLNKVGSTYSVRILKKYSRQYNAGGDDGLIDGIRGETNFRLGGWQGYQDTDFEAIVDLKEEKHIEEVGAGFLQDAKSWIWMPRYVEFYTSTDGKEWDFAGRLGHDVDEQDYTPQMHDLVLRIKTTDDDGTQRAGTTARYVKVFAKNFGTIPAWHLGAGGEGYIFVDEIIVR